MYGARPSWRACCRLRRLIRGGCDREGRTSWRARFRWQAGWRREELSARLSRRLRWRLRPASLALPLWREYLPVVATAVELARALRLAAGAGGLQRALLWDVRRR